MKLTSTLAIVLALSASASAQHRERARTSAVPPLVTSEPSAPVSFAAPAAEVDRSTPQAPGQKPVALPPNVRAVDMFRHEVMEFDVAEDGTQWVRGKSYKASFGAGGATYIPFLGAQAPQNYPLSLSLAAATVGGQPIPLAPATSALRDGARIVIERGAIDEAYELSLDAVEQTFVIHERPAIGELVLFVGIDTELERRDSSDGFEFANELGFVRYGRAFARESDGSRTAMSSYAVDGGVEIVVPAAYLARASYPLVIDPVISTFAIDTNSTIDDFAPDVAYDFTNDAFLVVYEEVYSTVDHDVRARILGPDGVTRFLFYADFTTDYWTVPKCANLNAYDQFLVVAEVRNSPGTVLRIIRGRTIEAGSSVMGAQFTISDVGYSGDKVNPDVGGDPWWSTFPGSAYCVVWQRNYSATDKDVHGRFVSYTGSLSVGTLLINNSGNDDENPTISKSNGPLTGEWGVVWHRLSTGASMGDIVGARIQYDGTLLSFNIPIAMGLTNDVWPDISSPRDDHTYLVTYLRHDGTQFDLHGALMLGDTVLDSENLTALDAPAELAQDQNWASVDTDGRHFAVVYSQSYGSPGAFDYDIWISSFATPGNQITLTEPRGSLDFSTQRDVRPDITSTYASGGTFGSDGARQRYFTAWDKTPSTLRDIRGGFYDGPVGGPVTSFCFGDGTNATPCPCSNNGSAGHGCANSLQAAGALLVSVGTADLANDVLSLQASLMPPNVTCTFFQGTSGSTPAAVFGDGLRCVFGSIVRIKTRTTNFVGFANYPNLTDPDVSVAGLVPAGGGTRYYQVSYRNSASFCTSATFNITNGVQAVWVP